MNSNLHSVALAFVLAAASLSSSAKPVAVEPGADSTNLQKLPAVKALSGHGETFQVAINPQPLPPKEPPVEERTDSVAPDLRLAGGGPPVVVDRRGWLGLVVSHRQVCVH